MHPVDADELLGQRVRDAAKLLFDPGIPWRISKLVRRPKSVEALAQQAAPVRAQPADGRRVGEIAGVQSTVWIFASQRGVDEASPLEQLLVRPTRIFSSEMITNRVVFFGEQGKQNFLPDPPTRQISLLYSDLLSGAIMP